MELLQNPFYILQATPRDNRAKLAELAEDASFSLDPDFCQKARTELTNPRKRLSAEIAWFPGISPASVTELLSILDSDFTALKNVSEYSGLVRFNLLIAGLSRVHEAKGTNLAQWVLYIAQSFKEIEIIGLCKAINEDRSVSGFPEITDCSWIDNELSERNKTGRNIINQALKALPTDDRIATLTYIIESATDEGNKHAPVLIHDLIDDYEIESKAELEKGEAAIKALVEKIKIHAGSGASVTSLSAMVDELITTLESWDKTAQPIQVSKKSLGLNHDLSQRIAIMVRGLAIHLYNEYSQLVIAKKIITNLQKIFSELLDIVEVTAEDAKTLNNIEENKIRENLYAGLEKINKAPSLKTINGFGFRLYGSTDTDTINGSYLTTYYFVAFFIPVIPVCRYRVIKNGNSYSFLGKAALSNFDKWHLGIAMSVVSFFIFSGIFKNSHTDSILFAPSKEPAKQAPASVAVEPSLAENSSSDITVTTDNAYISNQEKIDNTPLNTGLKTEIEQEKSEIETIESNLMRLKEEIQSCKALLDNYKANSNYESYNKLVLVYNSLLEEFRLKLKKYNELLNRVNAKITRYNAGER